MIYETQHLGKAAFVPIWFNAWEYENEANQIYPLLHTIRANYRNRLKPENEERGFFQSFRDVAVASVLLSADAGFRIATKALTGEALKFEDISKQMEAIADHT